MRKHHIQRVTHIVVVLFIVNLFSTQMAAQQVISCAGNIGKSNAAQISYTIGETVTNTIVGSETILTQGFHQGIIHLTAIESIELSTIEVSIFPNPATDIVHLMILNNEQGNYTCSIFDLSGRLLISKDFTDNETDISLGFLIPSTYFIKVYDKKRELKTFKIVKTTN